MYVFSLALGCGNPESWGIYTSGACIICLQGLARTQLPTNINYDPPGNRIRITGRSQPDLSAMERPLPGRTAFLITVSPDPGKYEWLCGVLLTIYI